MIKNIYLLPSRYRQEKSMISKKIVLKFNQNLADQPIIYKLVKHFNLEFNILKAHINPNKEGLMVLGLSGEENEINQGIDYLKKLGLIVQPLSQSIIQNNDRCTHCGVCISICPTEALVLDSNTRKIHFYGDKCIACEQCIPTCPLRAMEVYF